MSTDTPDQPPVSPGEGVPDPTAVQQPVVPTPPPAPAQSPVAPPPPPAVPPAVAAYQGQPGWQQPAPAPSAAPVGYAQQPYPQTSNNAVVALILGIVSWLVCPIIVAIIALVYASKADKEIKASNGWLTGHGMVLAAKILSWINIGFYILMGIFFLIMFVVAIASGGFEPDTFPTYEDSFSFGA